MEPETIIPPHLKAHTPLIKPAGVRLLNHMRQHPHAPRWNYTCGDEMTPADLDGLDQFREYLVGSTSEHTTRPAQAMLDWLWNRRAQVRLFQERLPIGVSLEQDWHLVPPMTREDIAVQIDRLIPDDVDLERMMIYETAGTTGHALVVPKDPLAVACYLALMERSLAQHGVFLQGRPDQVINFLIGAQAYTATYTSILSGWNGAGHAKLNFHPDQWHTAESPHRYFEAFDPPLVTGDPISFAEMLRLEIPSTPAAIVSTSVALSDGLRKRLSERYTCPVIDWYSLNEAGPIAYSCPAGSGHHILSPDLFVEILDETGQPVSEGETGEITITGGRNAFLPLLRYRTGDHGWLNHEACSCGDPMPRLMDLEGRPPVLFRDHAGRIVNPVDLSRILKWFPIVQHEFHQRADRSCTLTIRPVDAVHRPDTDQILAELNKHLGELPIQIRTDPHLGHNRPGGKVIPYSSDLA